MEALLPIIVQLVTGAIGGHAVSGALKQQAVSAILRTVIGAIGGVGGGILTGIVGAVMQSMKKS